jgi:hypothetical protein
MPNSSLRRAGILEGPMKDMLFGLIFVAVGLTALAIGIAPAYRRVSAHRTGSKVSAKVVSEEPRTGSRGFQTYLAKVRFQAPDGNSVEHFSQKTTQRSRLGQDVDVWYTPGDPARIWVDEPGAISSGAIFVFCGVAFTGAGLAVVLGH